jgi:hypothetical protein
VNRISILLIVVTLIAGIVGYGDSGDDGNGDGDVSLTLTIDSTAGGVVTVNNITIHGKSILSYDAGTVVSLNATPNNG